MSELRTSLPDIKLRALEPEDLDWLYKLENDRSLWDVGAAPMHYSRFALRQYIAAQPQDFFRDGELRLVVEADGQENPVGLVDLTNYSALDRRAEVGIALSAACRGCGYGRSALKSLEVYARRYLHLRMLYALVSAQYNERCRKTFLSVGYTLTATLKDWHRWGDKYEDIDLLQKNIVKNA